MDLIDLNGTHYTQQIMHTPSDMLLVPSFQNPTQKVTDKRKQIYEVYQREWEVCQFYNDEDKASRDPQGQASQAPRPYQGCPSHCTYHNHRFFHVAFLSHAGYPLRLASPHVEDL